MRDRSTKFKEKQTCTSESQTDIQTSLESDNPIQNNLERRACESPDNTGFQALTDNGNAQSERRSPSRHTRPRKRLIAPTIRNIAAFRFHKITKNIFDEFLRIYFGNKLKSNMIVKYN